MKNKANFGSCDLSYINMPCTWNETRCYCSYSLQYMGCNRKSENHNNRTHLLRVNVLTKLFRVETTTCRSNHRFMEAVFGISNSSIDDKASSATDNRQNGTNQIKKEKQISCIISISYNMQLHIMEFVVVANCDNLYMSNSHEASQKR